jgi:hypothetical protein
MASMLESTLGLPVISTTSVLGDVAITVFSTSIPDTGVMYTSTNIMWKRERRTISIASSPRPVTSTMKPSLRSTLAQPSRSVRSSSTISARSFSVLLLYIGVLAGVERKSLRASAPVI